MNFIVILRSLYLKFLFMLTLFYLNRDWMGGVSVLRGSACYSGHSLLSLASSTLLLLLLVPNITCALNQSHCSATHALIVGGSTSTSAVDRLSVSVGL
jgi:hypothetical protein